jgi:cysteine synthase A
MIARHGDSPSLAARTLAAQRVLIVESILDAIGNTPIIRMRRCAPPNGAELWLKLELRNPSGSMKDRMALAMIEGAERDGLISAGDTVVEYTGGSTGPALALVCAAKGYRALIVMADCFTEERSQLMQALGAEIDLIPSVAGPPKVTPQDIKNMVARAAELAEQPGHYATDQFNNPYIIPDHRNRLGREIWEQSKGRVTAFCQGMGTASSLIGVSDALRPHGVFIQGHEPASSAAITGGAPGPFLIQGWTGSVMPHWDPDKVDHVEAIEDDAALEMTRRLAREEGVFAGISTGANVVGAHRLAERLGPDAVIVTLAVDTGFKYMSVSPYGDGSDAPLRVG